MIVDSSALVAMARREPGHDELEERLSEAEWAGIGAPTVLETAMVLTGRGARDGLVEVQSHLVHLGLVEVSFGPAHREAAMRAFQRYGKGRHRAALNFGDCMSYALAQVEGYPLLYTGEDFSQTDIRPA